MPLKKLGFLGTVWHSLGMETTEGTFRTAVRSGEDMFGAIVRAGQEANRRGLSGYVIVCERCGQPVMDHELPTDCETWSRELGVLPFEV